MNRTPTRRSHRTPPLNRYPDRLTRKDIDPMTQQTSEQNTPTQTIQHTHHWILTLQHQNRRGDIEVGTFHAAFTPPAGWTRSQVYAALYDQISRDKDMPDAQTLFFSLEPNQI